MSVSLEKVTDYPVTDDIDERYAWGMDNESWSSTVLLPMYLATVFSQEAANYIYGGLKVNDLQEFATLLTFEHRYDNTTGKLV